MNYNKGDKALLYVEFIYNNEIVSVNNPQVRILHETNDVVYEDLEWQEMQPFDKGYIYKFDTNICDNYGLYVAVYKGEYNGETLNSIDNFNLIVSNTQDNNGIKIYGYINDIGSNRILTGGKVKVYNLESNEIVYETVADEDGAWECYIYPGDYNFEFSHDGYETRNVRAQVGDENSEVQFNNISMEKLSDRDLGNGLYRIEDSFTTKNNSPVENAIITLYNIDDLDNQLLELTTNNKGKWCAFLDDGTYIMKVVLPSQTELMFRMVVYNDGTHTIGEFSVANSQPTTPTTTGNEKEVTDFVINANGTPLSNASIKVYSYNNDTQEERYITETTTDDTGKFTLFLNTGVYKLYITCDNYKEQNMVLTV